MKIRQISHYSLMLILLFAVHSVPAAANEFRLSADGVGPIAISMQINIRNAKEELTAFPQKIAELTVSGRNDSGQPIRFAKFCVQTARRARGCDFQLWTKRVWTPGEELLWMIDKHARPGMEKAARITLVKYKIEEEKSNDSQAHSK